MSEFVAFDPYVQVSGHAIHAAVVALGDRVNPILEKYDLYPLDLTAWYSQQAWLDAFRELATGDFSAMLDLVSIGMRIPENAQWPPNVNTIEDAIRSVDQAYQMNHHGGEIGSYRVTQIDERSIEVMCDNPYPCDFDYGILYNTARMYQPRGASITVVHDDRCECRKNGGDSCTYHINW